jgi:phospholipase/carboxylesterase
MNMQSLEHIVIEPKKTPKASLILLHGLGADAHDFAPVMQQLGWAESMPMRFIFPTAPVQPITVNGGLMMRAWYDIDSFDRNIARQDEIGIKRSAAQVKELIEQEKQKGIEKVVIAGFSQGGAMALYTGLCCQPKVDGIIGLSTYLPISTVIEKEKHPDHSHVPILLAHGQYDSIIPLSYAEESNKLLLNMGYQPSFHLYPMDHSVCMEELNVISKWLHEHILK